MNRQVINLNNKVNGAGIMHNLIYRDEYASKKYNNRMVGIQMKQHVATGYDENENEINQESKAVAAEELVKRIQAGLIRISEVDFETLSQLERVAKQKRSDGKDTYFIMSEKGTAKSNDDHIFASFICFAFIVRDEVFLPTMLKPLGKARGQYT